MPNRSLIVNDTPAQAAIRVAEADRLLVLGSVAENVEGNRAPAAGDSGVVRAVGLGARAVADEPVPDRRAGLKRRLRRVERLSHRLAREGGSRRQQHGQGGERNGFRTVIIADSLP